MLKTKTCLSTFNSTITLPKLIWDIFLDLWKIFPTNQRIGSLRISNNMLWMGFGVPQANHATARYKLARKHLGDGFSEIITGHANKFALENSERVFETKTLQKAAKWLLPKIAESRQIDRPVVYSRTNYDRLILLKGRQMYFLPRSVKKKHGKHFIAKPISTIWNDIPTNNLQNEGGISFPSGKKPELLLARVISMISSSTNDIVLDSFLGSGTTAAVAAKLGRRFIGIESGEQAATHCLPRLQSVVNGEQSGISAEIGWKGGSGFRFYRLGPRVFDEDGQIRPDIRFPVLAGHIWFAETDRPWNGNDGSLLLGIHDDRAFAGDVPISVEIRGAGVAG